MKLVVLFPYLGLQHQKRQQKIEGRVTLDSLSSPSHTESKPTDPTADAKDGEHSDNDTHEEASLSEGNPAQVCVSEQDQKPSDVVQDEKENEEDDDSVID